MDKVNIIILDDIITGNDAIEANGFSTIEFENIGDDDAIIFENVPLNSSSFARKYESRPGEIFSSRIKVRFAGITTNQKVLVTKTYYNIIPEKINDMAFNDIVAKLLANDNFTIMDQTDPNTIYVGYAQRGTAHTSEAKFKIKRISTASSIVTIEWAGGDELFTKIFDNRAVLTYSFLK